MDSDLPFGYSHRQKRTHSQMEQEGSSSPSWDSSRLSVPREPSASPSNPHPHVSGLHLPRMGSMPSAPPRHYPGDGLDFRRPITSSDVIDLTNDDPGPSRGESQANRSGNAHSSSTRPSRLPRFGHDIIDLDDEELFPSMAPPDSPEIQVISSRQIHPPRREPPNYRRNDQDEDDIQFVRSNALPEAEARRRRLHDLDVMVGFLEDIETFRGHHHNYLRAHIEREVRRPQAPPRGRGHSRIHIGTIGFMAPDLNYRIAGFDMGIGGEGAAPPPPPPPPTYDAPTPAPEGFTRSPEEVDVLLCPNCEDELCSGETEAKRQVWVVKGCGHVYCGECTTRRSIKKSAKGKERQASAKTKPFKECVVEGCGKKVSNPKAMIQVFL